MLIAIGPLIIVLGTIGLMVINHIALKRGAKAEADRDHWRNACRQLAKYVLSGDDMAAMQYAREIEKDRGGKR